MRLNTQRISNQITHEGGKAYGYIKPVDQLRRSVMSCLLWEGQFYEDGVSIADRIIEEAQKVSPQELSSIAIEARNEMNLRHVPLLLASVLCKTGSGSSIVSDTIYQVIRRADELAEFVAVYAEVNGVHPGEVKKKLSAQAKKGLAKAFGKFDEYQLAKYDRKGAVKLRDVLFLCHAKPTDDDLYKRLISGDLKTPDTWEVALSGGADKKETFERLLKEQKLGYLALLRNLRNMVEAGVDRDIITHSLQHGKTDNILPFRFVAAARACPQLESALDVAMQPSIDALPKLSGRTVVMVDVSASMTDRMSYRSDMTRMDAACALASVINCENLRVFSFSNYVVEVPPRRGMAGVDAIRNSQPNAGTYLSGALDTLNESVEYDRIIVITDEQTHDGISAPNGKGYLINIASNKNGVGYGQWTHIDGFSESVIKYIYETEKQK